MRAVRMLAILLLVLALAPFAAPYNPSHSDEVAYGKLRAPSPRHPFGTDNIARDLFSRVLTGAQMSLEVALPAVFIALFVGVLLGVSAAMSGGWRDALIMRVVDVAMAVPRILLLLPIAAAWPQLSVWVLIALIGFTGWFDIARLVRSDVQGVLVRDFVLASKAMGVGRVRLVARHILPHLAPTLLVVGTLSLGATIALEAGLAFLGLGLRGDQPSLGTLLQESTGNMTAWWLSVFPGITIVLIMLVCNMIGDALRDALAPPQLHV